jgi:hypothetical protein
LRVGVFVVNTCPARMPRNTGVEPIPVSSIADE